jgi:hypothetical protein
VSASFQAFSKFLGDQWSIGDWKVWSRLARPASVPIRGFNRGGQTGNPLLGAARSAEPPQMLKNTILNGAAFLEAVGQGCPHERLLARVSAGALHHARVIDPATGYLTGAISTTRLPRCGARHRGGPAVRVCLTARRARDASSGSRALRAGVDDMAKKLPA